MIFFNKGVIKINTIDAHIDKLEKELLSISNNLNKCYELIRFIKIYCRDKNEQYEYQREKDYEKMYTVKDIADKLKVDERTVYRIIERKEIEFYRIASGIRISNDAYKKYLNKAKQERIDNYYDR